MYVETYPNTVKGTKTVAYIGYISDEINVYGRGAQIDGCLLFFQYVICFLAWF